MGQNNDYQTRDIYLASVLQLSGMPIIKIDNYDGKGVFSFRRTPKIEEIINAYFSDELSMNPKSVFEAWKAIKARVYSTTGNFR
jgi:hypothetical protein